MAKVRRKHVAKQNPLSDIGAAIDRLCEAGELLRGRLAEIDPLDHPARWTGVNDEIRALEQRIAGLRAEQQRAALVGGELRGLGSDELLALHAATSELAELVRSAGRVAAVAEAAIKLTSAASAALGKLRG